MSMMSLNEELQASIWESLQRMLILLGSIAERLANPLVTVEPGAAPIVEIPPFDIPAPVVQVTSPDVDVAPITAALQAVMDEHLGRIPESIDTLKELMRRPSSPAVSMTPVVNKLDQLLKGESGLESRFDYDVRTDGNPVYIGRAAEGTATTADWTITKFTWENGGDGNPRVTRAQVLTGAWDSRASLSW